MTPMQRYMTAMHLIQAGSYDKASQELLWCWDYGHIVDTTFYAVRISFVLGYLKRLCVEVPSIRSELTERLRLLQDAPPGSAQAKDLDALVAVIVDLDE